MMRRGTTAIAESRERRTLVDSSAESRAIGPVVSVVLAVLIAAVALLANSTLRAQQSALPGLSQPTDEGAPIIADCEVQNVRPVDTVPLNGKRPSGRIADVNAGLAPEDVIPGTGQEYPVDLSAVLQLAETQNPAIALGREAIQEALALQLQARGMLLPSLNAGTMYHLHQGPVQLSDGQILKVEEQSIYFGGGDWTVGSQTVAIPAVHIFGHLGDAYFAPLVATQVVASRTATSRAIENSSLLDVTSRYLALV